MGMVLVCREDRRAAARGGDKVGCWAGWVRVDAGVSTTSAGPFLAATVTIVRGVGILGPAALSLLHAPYVAGDLPPPCVGLLLGATSGRMAVRCAMSEEEEEEEEVEGEKEDGGR